ncbi:hypothetical protein WISP_114773 [Willisornis vidua]|uniref:CRIB domain-containing protein n=1 Tax=Willisornis vidua TaxID=1566151 RepID=A0ABQ9CUJ8_9PASS|nr:hypothetical protein WISP_114773 [Willisornis vidua]
MPIMMFMACPAAARPDSYRLFLRGGVGGHPVSPVPAAYVPEPGPGQGEEGAGEKEKKRRRRLDRNMIGEPMNFVHTAHVGARDMSSDYTSAVSIQDHMKSKGGYTNGTSATVEI